MTKLDHDWHTEPADRPTWRAIRRGWRRRCPQCGQGRLFSGYLTLRADCATCGTDLSHARADDGPAYFAILITAKITGPAMLAFYTAFEPEPWFLAGVFCAAAAALALWLLPRLKGAIVAIQWAKRMHGF
ncbi:MAG: DUF983 domain-containing protein [Pseudomonadota bacterium]